MESLLKRVLDYKVVFDCLADSSNGMIKLETLTARWPLQTPSSQIDSQTFKFPSGCVEQWKELADDNGYLDWEKFSTGLEKVLKAQSPSTSKKEKETQSKAEQTLQSLRDSNKGSLNVDTGSMVPQVNVAEIESFLASCSGESLALALTRTRKEVYQCQLSLHRMTSPANSAPAVKDSTVNKTTAEPSKEVDRSNTSFVGAAGNEKEELMKGIELLENTRQWFCHRMDQISLEGSSKKLKAEDLLAALERGGKGQNETLKHIQEINTHLSAVAQAALLLEQHRPSSGRGRTSSSRPHRISSDPGPTAYAPQSGISNRVPTAGGAPPTSTVQMHFQAYSSNTQRPTNRRSPVRSVSLNEVRNAGVLPSRPSVSYRGDGGSANRPMNVGTSSHQPSGGSKSHHKPRRAHSFSYKDPESFSSSSSSSQSSMTTDHSRARPHSLHTQQYPLRETTSLRDVQSTSSREQYSSQSHGRASPHGYNYNPPPTRSSSVRNIPTSSYYGPERSSQQPSPTSPGHKQKSFLGSKPLYGSSQSMTARVESVDIPDQVFEMPPSSYPTPGVRSGSSRGDTGRRTSKQHLIKSKEGYQNGTAAPRQHISNSMLSIV